MAIPFRDLTRNPLDLSLKIKDTNGIHDNNIKR